MQLPSRYRRFTGVCLLLICTVAGGEGSIPGWNTLVYLNYRLEVTNYCGLTSEPVGQGYRTQRDLLLQQYGFDKLLIESAQSEAWKLAYREWDNRGLGGFRRWCQKDGTRYANWFIRVGAASGSN